MQRSRHPDRIGVLLAGGGVLAVSLDSLGIRLSEADSWDVAFWLGLFSFVAMSFFVLARTGTSLVRVASKTGTPMAVSGTLSAASLTFFVLALNITTVANTVIIIAVGPIAAALIANLVLGERTSVRTWVAIAMTAAGLWTVVFGSLGSGRLVGDLFAVAAIVAFASNLTLWRRYPDLDRRVVVGLGGLITAVVALGPADPFKLDARALLILAALGLVTRPFGLVSVATATRYLAPAQVGLFIPVETVAATTWAWLFLAETPAVPTIVGGLIVIAGVIYGSLGGPSRPVVAMQLPPSHP